MKILIVSPYFYPEGGGLERYAYEMALELKKENEVTVVCSTKNEPRNEVLDGIRVIRRHPLFIVSNTPIKLSLPFELVSMVKREKFDIIIAHTPVPFYADVASLVAKLAGIPLVIYYHVGKLEKGLWLDKIARLYSQTLEKVTLSGAKLFAVSHYVARLLFEKGFNAKVRYPRISGVFLSERPRYSGEYILFVGQLTRAHRWKNLSLVLDAFAQFLKILPGERLVVVGGGELLDYYQQLTKKRGIEYSVTFSGFVSDRKLVEYYKNAKVLVLPSSGNEAFGKVVLEAMTLGTPVIVSNLGEFPFVVEHGKEGLVIKPEVEELVSSLVMLLENEKLRRKMAVLARRRMEALMGASRV
ncbi:glycosyltransferase family 4 protein [Thermococcus sp.]|uniref:glycosyltransferase family 4 protein n=1 Tax=Thermococcus sp. TaxID=35749 RepID=UPI0026155781|nr:glycosyltransferase family 4 protein [Thermococcus sp.]